MLKRIWRVFIALITLGIVRLENKNAGAVRNQIIDEKVGQVAQASKGLGELAGAARQQTREVARLEAESKALVNRKAHFLGTVKSATPDSQEATAAKASALDCHRQNAEVLKHLNAAREELVRLANEYEISKELVSQAQTDVRAAKKRGATLDQRKKSATRREQLVRTTSSLRGVAGIGDELAAIDEQLEAEIDGLEGAAYVAADLASDGLRERQLDAQIAQQETDATFEAELAAMEADTSDVVDVKATSAPQLPEPTADRDVPSVATPEREPVLARTASANENFGPSDFESSDSGSDSSSSD